MQHLIDHQLKDGNLFLVFCGSYMGFMEKEVLCGTAMYLRQVQKGKSLKQNIMDIVLNTTGYLYEEPLLLPRQEVQEPGTYCAIIEAIAGGASKANEIATKTGEPSAKCLKYINTLCELGILYKETPFVEIDLIALDEMYS